jgi:tripartite-type tricarboxylate transporter receptor subunit TctC
LAGKRSLRRRQRRATSLPRANADAIKAMHDPEIRKKLADLGRDDRMMSPAQLSAFIQSEQQKWSPIVQEIAAQTQRK